MLLAWKNTEKEIYQIKSVFLQEIFRDRNFKFKFSNPTFLLQYTFNWTGFFFCIFSMWLKYD